MNNISVVGRMAKDPELRFTGTGKAVANFSVAVPKRFDRDNADFFDCVAWQKLAENVSNHCYKGQRVAVNGRIESREYETNQGQKRKVYEIVCDEVEFLEYRENTTAGSAASEKNTGAAAAEEAETEPEIDLDEFEAIDDDEDTPF